MPDFTVTQDMLDALGEISLGLALTGRGDPGSVPSANVGDPLLPFLTALHFGGDFGVGTSGSQLAQQFATRAGFPIEAFNAHVAELNRLAQERRTIGGDLTDFAIRAVGDVGEFLSENPALLLAAPLGLAAAGGAFGAGAAGASSGSLAPVTTTASAIPMTAAQQAALANLGFSVAPASAGLASFPALGALGGGGAALSGAAGAAGGSGLSSIFPRLGGLQGLGALIGGASGLLGSIFGPDEQTVTQQTQLPPSVQQALDFIINQSMGLADQGNLVPGLSDVTMQGIGALSSPLSGPGFDSLSGFASGNFINPFMGSNDLSGITDSITDAATRAVADRFSMAGRSGSPAEGITLGKTVARELAPFAFGARESQLGREFAAGESLLDRRLGAALPLMNLQRQSALDMLSAGSILDDQARRAALEPFMRLDMLTGPLVSAISGAPRSTSTTTPLFSNPLLSGLGGALAGSQLGGLFG